MATYLALPETAAARAQLLCDQFHLSEEVRKRVITSFVAEIKAGLKAHLQYPSEWKKELCSMIMLDTFIKNVPSGNEETVAYALDIGGTNVRFMRIETSGNGLVKEKVQVQNLRHYKGEQYEDGLLDKHVPASVFFDFFALGMKRLMEQWGDKVTAKPYNLGLTFSFACVQKGLTSSELMFWTKGFSTGMATDDPVEKRDVGQLLSEALQRNNVPLRLVAIVNDTVGTLMCGAYEKPPDYPQCCISVIAGTGFNASYLEEEAEAYNYKGKLINTECGCFDKSLPETLVDLEVDWYSVNPGLMKYEKMVSGMLMGEMVRHAVIICLQEDATADMWRANTLLSESVCDIAEDTTPNYSSTQQVLANVWKNSVLSPAKISLIQQLCKAILDRSACLLACGIYGMAERINKVESGVTCAVDGALLSKHPLYFKTVNQFIDEIAVSYGKVANIKMVISKDGSGRGAALLAAVTP